MRHLAVLGIYPVVQDAVPPPWSIQKRLGPTDTEILLKLSAAKPYFEIREGVRSCDCSGEDSLVSAFDAQLFCEFPSARMIFISAEILHPRSQIRGLADIDRTIRGSLPQDVHPRTGRDVCDPAGNMK